MVLEKTHKITLYNDSKHDFLYVIACLIKFCKHSPDQAEQCAVIVDGKGEYDIKFRERVAQTGTTYFGGGILPKEQKVNNYKPNKHYQAKANGYQPENKGLVKPPVEDKEFIDDELPF